MEDVGHWVYGYEDMQITPSTFGFIYIIENAIDEKFYIGKKQCRYKVTKKPLKGKSRKRISSKESDWRTYTGSSDDLNEDIKRLGIENFTFVIIEECNSKWSLSYNEAKHIIKAKALYRNDFYNKMLRCRVGKAPKRLEN